MTATPPGPVPGPLPPANPLPAAAVPGHDVPALPRLPEPLYAAYPESDSGWPDPVLDVDLGNLVARRPVLAIDPLPGWSVATVVALTAPPRRQGSSVLSERPTTLTIATVPEPSLNPVSAPVELERRLRMLYERLLPASTRFWPTGSQWYWLGGAPATLDRFREHGAVIDTAFQLTTAPTDDLGFVALGSSSQGRATGLNDVVIPTAAAAYLDGRDLVATAPPGWRCTEGHQITTPDLLVRANAEPLLPGTAFDEWVDEVFDRAPFLRGRVTLAERDIDAGFDRARLWRFDWQPSGMGRLLTTVVAAVVGDIGVQITYEVPFHGDQFLVDPDELVAMVRCR